MALIECPECGKKVSDIAVVCVHCGYPIEKYVKRIKVLENGAKPPTSPCPVCKACNYKMTIDGDFACTMCGYTIENHVGIKWAED